MAFCRNCGTEVNEQQAVCTNCGYMLAAVPQSGGFVQDLQEGRHNKWVAILLAFFLGGFGAHKFYLGKIGQGILYLLFCWTFIPSFIAFVEMIIYLSMSDKAFAAKYN